MAVASPFVDAPFFFDPVALAEVAQRVRPEYLAGHPFPHVVIDGLVPDDLLDEVVRESPGADLQENWVRWTDDNSVKRGLRDDWTMGPTTRLLLNQCNSAAFVNFLEDLTGITGLIPDPHYFGGGLHTIERGGYLRVHADFNHYPRLNLERRINALLYLNRDWQDEWGGHLELWDETLSRREAMIAPLFNRMVIFATTDTAYHGHPNPLTCPPGVARRSLALYYYSVDRPAEERTEPHSTLWQPGVGELEPRPGEPAPATGSPDGADTAPEPAPEPVVAPDAGRTDGPGRSGSRGTRATLRDWTPPVLWRAAHRVTGGRRT
jgi:hypothetical protein